MIMIKRPAYNMQWQISVGHGDANANTAAVRSPKFTFSARRFFNSQQSHQLKKFISFDITFHFAM